MACKGLSSGVDLHIHTSVSDGEKTPEQILLMASQLRLSAIAITDHDTVSGVAGAVETGIPDGLGFAPGVEISAQIPDPFPRVGVFHLLGYFIDINNPDLKSALLRLKQARKKRNPKIIEKLSSMNIDISMEEVLAFSGAGQAGRPHIAKILLNKGYVADMNEAFDRYIGKNGRAYVDKFCLPASEAISVIQQAGGIPVIAHPYSLCLDRTELTRFIETLKEMGLGGIEAYYPSHEPAFTEFCLDIARKLDLAVTGGTDYHGANKPGISLGRGKGSFFVPDEIFDMLLKKQGNNTLKKEAVTEKTPLHDLPGLEKKLSHKFKDRKLLEEALCHPSFHAENKNAEIPHYERLEFLGDAVFGLVVGHIIMKKFPDYPEGDLSRLRAYLVNESGLAKIAREIDIGPHILLGRGEDQSGGRDKNKILADCMESVIGALYLDGGFEAAFFAVAGFYSHVDWDKAMNMDFKSKLQEITQESFRATPKYKEVGQSGPDHERTFIVLVNLPDGTTASGTGKTKKAAQQDAARMALDILKNS